MDFALYGSWEARNSSKRLSQGVGTFSTIEDFILRTLIFRLFSTLFRPSQRVGRAFLGSQALARPAGRPAGRACLRGPHRAQDVWLSGFSGALCQPSLAVGTGLAELLATSFLKLLNKRFNEMRGPAERSCPCTYIEPSIC